MDIYDVIEWAHSDCVFDIFDCDRSGIVKENCSVEDVKKWATFNLCWLESFEPIQDDDRFGIQINVSHIEKIGGDR